jgi:outer membrane protein assembly factor BamD (BamD/ComL family)
LDNFISDYPGTKYKTDADEKLANIETELQKFSK